MSVNDNKRAQRVTCEQLAQTSMDPSKSLASGCTCSVLSISSANEEPAAQLSTSCAACSVTREACHNGSSADATSHARNARADHGMINGHPKCDRANVIKDRDREIGEISNGGKTWCAGADAGRGFANRPAILHLRPRSSPSRRSRSRFQPEVRRRSRLRLASK